MTTVDALGAINIAPMGPRVDRNLDRFELKPFKTSTTFRNLKNQGEGVFHVTDDVLLIARSAVGQVFDAPTQPAETVRGFILTDACRYHEFKVVDFDESAERARIVVETVHRRTLRDFFGFNRAKNAVLEAAILATRLSFLPLEEVASEFSKFREIVTKTGGDDEHEALRLLTDQLMMYARKRGVALEALEA